MTLAQKYAINKKSTIFVSSLWNLVKMTNSWLDYIGRISAQLDVNCGFFTNSIFILPVSFFSEQSLYSCRLGRGSGEVEKPEEEHLVSRALLIGQYKGLSTLFLHQIQFGLEVTSRTGVREVAGSSPIIGYFAIFFLLIEDKDQK